MNEENDKTKDIDEVVADTEKSEPLEESDVNDAEENLEEEQEDDLEDESEPAPEGLHALDFTPSESSTTNIPPRLPEGFSYNQTQPTVTRKKSKKKQPKVAENVVTVDTDKPLRSEPSTVRSRKYRTHHPNRAMLKAQLWWSRYKWWATGGVVVLAMGVTYPFWGERLGQLMQPKEETPVVAADTILPTKDTTAVDTLNTVPQLTHEDSIRIQDSVRHARWVYYQRRRRQEAARAQKEQNNGDLTQEQNGTTTTTPTTPKTPTTTHTTHGDSVH